MLTNPTALARKLLALTLSFCLLLTLVLLPSARTHAASAPGTVRILYIGNSMIYFADMPGKIQAILQAMGYTVEYQQVTPGGSFLSQHAQAGSDARKAIQNGYNGSKWNYVIVNGNTMEPANAYSSLLASAQTLKSDTDTYNPGAQFILHSTNPFSPATIVSNSSGAYTDTNAMANDVSSKYASIASALGVKYGPNTQGMQKLFNDGIKNASVIWNADGKHHTDFSHYMAAAIYAAMITGVDPTYFTQNGGLSAADADYAKSVAKSVILSSNQGITLGAPPVSVPSGSIKIEAESMALTNYTVENNSSATNGSLIKVNANTTGTATQAFTGSSGQYDVKITYWDESDGNSTYNLYSANQLIGNWIANEATGSIFCDSTTRRTRTISNVTLHQNDVIKLSSNYDGDEYGRIDVIEFIPKPVAVPVKIEAETMALTNYTVESNSSATNGSLIKVVAGTTGTATQAFTGTSGIYTVKITYWDESDGNSTYNLYSGNQLIGNWMANEATGSIYCDSTTRRTRTISNVTINQNDLIKITSNYNGDEYGRIDVIEFIPAA
ncbi:hypothetical protein PaecuDRAFT_2372 [Paenibacillus curdlanolyticus YK9]|uniref:Uncharacterized protein n=1 Tax=Paenibacillus curdlanolyticus YK9 TaxID=717606 RepID=E0I9N5_9BACL|nr:hypothetical protein [Paenibacillus curdlanolyticus]EFM11119.1 hypothetical protein PaecuDRAFT_2372 [Paenibacillus curdlanolyticus YK9]